MLQTYHAKVGFVSCLVLTALVSRVQAQNEILVPQVVAGRAAAGDYTTKVNLLNPSSQDCQVLFSYILGGGNPLDTPVLTNGVNRGNLFFETVPANGTLPLMITPEDLAELATFSITIDPLAPSCSHVLQAQAEYTLRSPDGGPVIDLFSYVPLPAEPFGNCVLLPADLDPDASDGTTLFTGIAVINNPPSVRIDPPVELIVSIEDQQGAQLPGAEKSINFDGSRQVHILNDSFFGLTSGTLPENGALLRSVRRPVKVPFSTPWAFR